MKPVTGSVGEGARARASAGGTGAAEAAGTGTEGEAVKAVGSEVGREATGDWRTPIGGVTTVGNAEGVADVIVKGDVASVDALVVVVVDDDADAGATAAGVVVYPAMRRGSLGRRSSAPGGVVSMSACAASTALCW